MSWRRRVLAFSVVLGAGIFCFGPVMTHSVSRRISVQWNTNATIQTAKLSIPNHAMTLKGFALQDPQLDFQCPEVFLRFDADRLLYRDCVIESLNAQNAIWRLSTSPALPDTTPAQSKIANSKIVLNDVSIRLNEDGQALERYKESLLVDIQKIQTVVLEARNASSHKSSSIEFQLEELSKDVEGLRSPDAITNPLRASRTIEAIRSRAHEIDKLLAEERLSVMNARKQLDTSVLAIRNSISKQTELDTTRFDIEQLAEAILKEYLTNYGRLLNPYLHASETAATRFFNLQSSIASGELLASRPMFATSDLGTDFAFSKVRPRLNKIIKGRVQGTSVQGDVQEAFDLHLQSSEKSYFDNSGQFSIFWKPLEQSGELVGKAITQSFAKLVSASGDNETNESGSDIGVPPNITYQIRRDESNKFSTVKLEVEAKKVGGTISASLAGISATPSFRNLAIDLSKFEETNSQLTVNASFELPTNNDEMSRRLDLTNAEWQVSTDTRSELQAYLQGEVQRLSVDRFASAQREMQQRFEQDTADLKQQLQVLESDLKTRQDKINSRLAAELGRAKEWESQQLRTSNLAAPAIR